MENNGNPTPSSGQVLEIIIRQVVQADGTAQTTISGPVHNPLLFYDILKAGMDVLQQYRMQQRAKQIQGPPDENVRKLLGDLRGDGAIDLNLAGG